MIATSLPIGLLPTADVCERERRELQAIEGFDVWFVEERLRRKALLPEEQIAPAILGFRRYIALRVLGYEGYTPSEAVDTVWHTFLLFTREYAEFCRAIGIGFIHHVPFTSRKGPGRPPLVPYAAIYRRHFGGRDEGPACGCRITPCGHTAAECGCSSAPDDETKSCQVNCC